MCEQKGFLEHEDYGDVNETCLDKWSNDIVYAIYCKDDLNKLPVTILEQMKEHLQSIINLKNHREELNDMILENNMRK